MATEADEVTRSVLSAQVKDRILQWIVEGRLAPGSRIVETRVARDLGTSQAPVREALRDLAGLGVVEMQAYRGAWVRQPSRRELVQAIQVRAELEALAAREATERMDEERLRELEGLLGEMTDAAERGDAQEHAVKNASFHAAVMKTADNPALERAWRVLEPYLRTYLTASRPGVDLVWLAQRHQRLLDAFRLGDGEAAAAAMRIHLQEAAVVVGATVPEGSGKEGRR